MSITPEPIGADADGTPQYAQATMEGPNGEQMTVVASTPPEIGGGEAEGDAAELEAG
jgi:hypothetical protein